MINQPLQSDAEDRLAQWVGEHGRAVRGYLLGMTRSPETADDLTQEVFRRAWEARHRYQESGNARAYLLCIADRLACDQSRRKGREQTLGDEQWRSLEPADDTFTPGESLVQTEMQQQLTIALESLSPEQRRVLLLRYYSDMSFKEIAQATESPLNTVLSHCRRGLLALRKMLVEDSP